MCKTVSNIILFIVNTICMIVAIILIVVGALLQWGQDTVRSKILPGLFKLASNNDGQATLTMESIAKITNDYINVLSNSGLILFIIGVILFVIAFSGLVGVCCRNRCLLIIYILLTTVIFVLIVIFVIVFFVQQNQLKATITDTFYTVVTTKYTFHNSSLNTTSGLDITGIIDLIQARVGCCGSYNGTDYAKVSGKGNHVIPYTCCIMNATASFTPLYSNCTTNPINSTSFYNLGCSTYLWNIVNQYATYAGYSLVGLAVVLFILIIMAAVLIRSFEET